MNESVFGKIIECYLQCFVPFYSLDEILTNQPPEYVGSELVRAKIEINGTSKDALSTFFPQDWDEARVLEEVALIMKTPTNQVGGNIRKYKGLATDGITNIEIRLTGPNGNLNFDTVFPY